MKRLVIVFVLTLCLDASHGIAQIVSVDVIYESITGNLSVHADQPLTGIKIDSEEGVFKVFPPSPRLSGPFDVHSPHRIAKAVFLGSFEDIDFGPIVEPRLTQAFLDTDWSISGTRKDPLPREFQGGTIQVIEEPVELRLIYDASDGNVAIQGSHQMTGLQLTSTAGIFTGEGPSCNLEGPFDVLSPDKIGKAVFDRENPSFQDVDFCRVAEPKVPRDLLLNDLEAEVTLFPRGRAEPVLSIEYLAIPLRAGDANQDFEVDFEDLLLVLAAGKFEAGDPATWGEGDWDGAPGGSQGNPPAGDGAFNFDDMLATLAHGLFETGPYAAASETQSVPEPSTFVLAALGLLALLSFTHRRPTS